MAALVVGQYAHPLGNFSVNQYSGIEFSKSEIKIRQVVDMAEIPTFQASVNIDTNKDGKLSQGELDAYAADLLLNYLPGLHLFLSDQALALRPISTKISLAEGSGGLSLIRIVWELTADLPQAGAAGKVRFENSNNAERIGWNEIVVTGTSDISIFNSTAYSTGLSEELRSYPQDAPTAPLNERAATFSVTTGQVPADALPLKSRDGRAAVPVQKDRLAELISIPEITPGIILLGLLLAFGLGAMHAMSPGHGKTIVGAYLVGSRGTAKHAAFLGLTVTITHTIGVFAIGLVTLFASNYVLPERLMPFLSFVSGLLVFYIGISLFKSRLFSAMGWQTQTHGHSHSDGDPHHEHANGEITHTHDGSTHTHLPPESITFKSLLALGISGGLLPCPSALVLMLAAISRGRVGYGLILTLAFSLGLAATLTSVGLIFLYLGKMFGGTSLANNRLVKALPVFSSLVIACVGAVICYNALG